MYIVYSIQSYAICVCIVCVYLKAEFASGQDIAQLSITVRADGIAENNEYINISLSGVVVPGSNIAGAGATIGMLL